MRVIFFTHLNKTTINIITLKRIIGGLIIFSVFAAIFIWMTIDTSLIAALQSFGLTALIVFVVSVGVILLDTKY